MNIRRTRVVAIEKTSKTEKTWNRTVEIGDQKLIDYGTNEFEILLKEDLVKGKQYEMVLFFSKSLKTMNTSWLGKSHVDKYSSDFFRKWYDQNKNL